MVEILVIAGVTIFLVAYVWRWRAEWSADSQPTPAAGNEPRYLFQTQEPDQMCSWDDGEEPCDRLGSFLWTDPRDMREHPVCWNHGESYSSRRGGFVDIR